MIHFVYCNHTGKIKKVVVGAGVFYSNEKEGF
jgi:hypothetical protein